MSKSRLLKLICISVFFPGRVYRNKGYDVVSKVKTLIKTVLLLSTFSLIFFITMFLTKAYYVSTVSTGFFLLSLCSYFIVKNGYYKAGSNLILLSLFTAFYVSIKVDQYVSVYELYVYGAFSLILTLVTCLISYRRRQLLLVYLFNLAGLINIFFSDVFRIDSTLDHLEIQSLITVFALITIGTISVLRLTKLQINLIENLNKEKNQVDKMLRIAEVYTKKSLVSIISNGGDPTTFIPRGEDIAVLFCDIRDFTSFSENMNAVDTIRLLNSFFNRMNRVIQDGKGEIDKLIGDCIMASFNSCDDAVNSSIHMAKELQSYNRERISYNLDPIHTGTGIGFGNVAVGNIGSSNKMDYTVIGDVVNVSSRLESLTKVCGVDIIISDDVYRKIPNSEFSRCLGEVMVKGRSQAIKIYEIFNHEMDKVRDKKLIMKPYFEEAIELFNNKFYDEAIKIYKELIKSVGPHTYRKGYCKDPVLQYFLSLCVERGLSSSRV